MMTLPFGTTISPDYGYARDAPGYLDFFLDGAFNIGIELTRDGNALKSHGARFSNVGVYSPLCLSSWVVVDLRIDSVPQRRTLVDNPSCLFVSFSQNFTRAAIFELGKEQENIVLHSVMA
jgi:hypothetical protein